MNYLFGFKIDEITLQFQSVLAKSDKMMAVVKDLFGDAPNVSNARKML